MARPQIPWTGWDKPTSPVGRDESINHGIVIPNAERLRVVCRLFSLGKVWWENTRRFLPSFLLRKNYLYPLDLTFFA